MSVSLNPTRQRGQSSRAQGSFDWILTSLWSGFTCSRSVLIFGTRTHSHVPTVRLGHFSPASPPHFHALASGKESRKDRGCFLFLFVFLFVFFCWTDSLGFLRVSTTSEREGVQDRVRKKKKVWRNKKAEDKLTGEEKLKELKVEKCWIFVKEEWVERLCFKELVEGTEQKSVEMFI